MRGGVCKGTQCGREENCGATVDESAKRENGHNCHVVIKKLELGTQTLRGGPIRVGHFRLIEIKLSTYDKPRWSNSRPARTWTLIFNHFIQKEEIGLNLAKYLDWLGSVWSLLFANGELEKTSHRICVKFGIMSQVGNVRWCLTKVDLVHFVHCPALSDYVGDVWFDIVVTTVNSKNNSPFGLINSSPVEKINCCG